MYLPQHPTPALERTRKHTAHRDPGQPFNEEKGGPDLQLDAVVEGLGEARLVRAAAKPDLVAVGPVAHKAQLRHVGPRAPVWAACQRSVNNFCHDLHMPASY